MNATASDVGSETVPRPTKDTEQITFRLPREWIAKADDLAKRISPPGAMWGRTDALRACIARGFEAFERDEMRRKFADIDEDDVYDRASRMHFRAAEREGVVPMQPSKAASGFTDRGIYELRNGGGILRRFKYDVADDKLRMIK